MTASEAVWLHGASVGDARALGPLLDAARAEVPNRALLLTVGRETGRSAARRWYPDLTVTTPPWRTSWSAGRFLDRHRIGLVLLEYLELWPGWMAAAAEARCPVVVIDGRVTGRSLRIAPLLRRAAQRISLFCAQAPADAEGAVALGVAPERVHVTGTGKHDRIGPPPLPGPDLLAALGAFDVVVGSLNTAELDAATAAFAAFRGRVLWAPRELTCAPSILRAGRRYGRSVGLRSAGAAQADWAVLDTHGELAAAYGLARAAVAGGTFCRREGQNLVEAAAHGLPVVHGPRTAHVREEAEALVGRGGHPVPDWGAAVARLEAIRAGRMAPGDPGPALVALRGAVARQMRLIRPFLEGVADR